MSEGNSSKWKFRGEGGNEECQKRVNVLVNLSDYLLLKY